MTCLLSGRVCTALVVACLGGVAPKTVLAQPAALTPTPKVANAELTVRACKAVAAVADRGAAALKAADLSREGHGQLLDLSNDGHPRIIHFDTEGTAHGPVLEDEHGNEAWEAGAVWHPLPEPVRWADELSVLKVEGRTWVVSWDAGTDVAVLDGASDGHVTCEFRTEWLPPKITLLSGGQPGEIPTYQDMLSGKGHTPSRIEFHDRPKLPASAQMWTGGADLGVDLGDGWKVDLDNSGHPTDLVRVGLVSSAGAGCEYSQLGEVRDGTVVALLLGTPLLGYGLPPIVPFAPSLDLSRYPYSGDAAIFFFHNCGGGSYVPVLDDHGRAYVMLDTTDAGKHLTAGGVRVLAGARDGKLQPLARLVWAVRNQVTNAAGP